MFANILRDSGAADKVIDVSKDKDVEKRLLTEYKVITAALERLGHGYESVDNSIHRMIEEFPNVLR